jgi:hypothetical protein
MTTFPADPNAPRLLGFDVPDLHSRVDHAEDEAIVAMLDVEPSIAWLQLFHAHVDALKGELGLAGVAMDGRSIRFFGSIADSRRLANEITGLIKDVAQALSSQR